MIFLEILIVLIVIALMVIVWLKTRSLTSCLTILHAVLPTLKSLAEKTDTKLDDKIVAYLERLTRKEEDK